MIHPGVSVLEWCPRLAFPLFLCHVIKWYRVTLRKTKQYIQHSVARRRLAERVHSSTLSVSKWWLQGLAVGLSFALFLQVTAARALRGHRDGLQFSFRRTGEEFAFRSAGEVKTLKQASGHAETAELSLEAGEVLSGSGLPDCRLEPKIGDWEDWGLHRSRQLTSRRTFREHGLLCCVACNPSRLRVSDVDNPTRLFRIVRTVI